MNKPVLRYYLLSLILFSGIGIPFFRDALSNIILLILSVMLIVSSTVYYNSKLKNVIAIWTIYCLILMIYYSEFFEGFYLRHILYIVSSFIIVTQFKTLFFIYYERYIYYLSIISLVFFSWQLLDIDSIHFLFKKFDLANSAVKGVWLSSKSILVYTLHGDAINFGNMRNCGFTWEPGPFSVFIAFAIYFNLLRNKFILKGNHRLLIFVITLATTLSTTGVVALLGIAIEIIILNYKGMKRVLLILTGGSIIIFLFFSLDFLSAKITSLYSSGNAEAILQQVKTSGEQASLGRFAGYAISWEEFKQRPLFGTAGASGQSYFANLGYSANMVSGLASIIGMYGLFGIVILLYYSIKSSKLIAKEFNSKTQFSLMIILLVGLFGFHLEIMPIFYAFLFYSLFHSKSNVKLRTNGSKNITPSINERSLI
jgi:hypothetical protein